MSKFDQGVCNHSRDSAFEKFFIMAVGDAVRTAAFKQWAMHNNIDFKQVHGCYKGVEEEAFILNIKHLDLMRSAWLRFEESVLVLSELFRDGVMYGARRAYLLMLNAEPKGVMQDIGFFVEADKKIALTQSGWTYDYQTNKYWVVFDNEAAKAAKFNGR